MSSRGDVNLTENFRNLVSIANRAFQHQATVTGNVPSTLYEAGLCFVQGDTTEGIVKIKK